MKLHTNSFVLIFVSSFGNTTTEIPDNQLIILFIGYLLADNCYDVWLGNNRGNTESKRHVSIPSRHAEFWQFSWHQMGQYDIPASIDFILNKTNHSKLHYMGHSQGTTQFFVFGALHPEYHHKIHTMHALSPVAYMKNLKSPIAKILSIFSGAIEVSKYNISLFKCFFYLIIYNYFSFFRQLSTLLVFTNFFRNTNFYK